MLSFALFYWWFDRKSWPFLTGLIEVQCSPEVTLRSPRCIQRPAGRRGRRYGQGPTEELLTLLWRF